MKRFRWIGQPILFVQTGVNDFIIFKKVDRQKQIAEWQSGAFLSDSIAGIKSVDDHDTSRDFAYSKKLMLELNNIPHNVAP